MKGRLHTGSRGVLLLSVLAAFNFGAIVSVAAAAHYHDFLGINHGLVHGSSTTDGSYFARVDNPPTGSHATCYVYEGATYIASDSSTGPAGCSAWSGYKAPTPNECYGIAKVQATGYVSQHDHYHHNGYGC